MAWTYNSTSNVIPSTHVQPIEDRFARLYFDNEPVTINWTGGTEASLWTLRNYYGDVVSSGSVSGTSVNLGILPLGWYKIYFSHSNPAIGTALWGPCRGEISFGVLRSSSPLRTTPLASNLSLGIANGGQRTNCYTGMAPYRMDIDLDSVHPGQYAGSLQQAKDEIAILNANPVSDSARPRPLLVQFPEGTGGMTPSGTDVTQITQAVTQLSALGVEYFEARNEPNTGAYTGANYVTELAAFYNTVKAANPSVKVVGGCSVTLADVYIDTILAAGAANYMDVMSVHAYNGTNGNLAAGRASWDALQAILTKHGFTKPLWMSEYGQFAHCYGSFEPRLQAQWATLDLHMAEQHGVPRERYMWFYDVNVGFWDYPSFIWTNDFGVKMPTALPIIMRVWCEETWGKNYSSRLDFGIEDDQWVGSKFTAGDGSSVVILQSGGGSGTVSFDVVGAASLTTISTFGAQSIVPVVDGKISIPISMEPSYVRLPGGVSFVPTAVDYGIEVIRGQFSNISAASTDGTGGLVTSVIDGKSGNNGAYNNIGSAVYRSDVLASPSWVRIDFPTVTRLDRVTVFCPHPWQNDSTLLDFDVQYLANDNVTWVTIATFTDTSAADRSFKWISHVVAGACFTDSFWNRRHIFSFPFGNAIQTRAIRLYVRNVSAGGGAVPEINTAYGALDAYGNPVNNGQTGPKRISLMEITAHLSPVSDGGSATVGQKMLAIK